jgi:hypothetical protein
VVYLCSRFAWTWSGLKNPGGGLTYARVKCYICLKNPGGGLTHSARRRALVAASHLAWRWGTTADIGGSRGYSVDLWHGTHRTIVWRASVEGCPQTRSRDFGTTGMPGTTTWATGGGAWARYRTAWHVVLPSPMSMMSAIVTSVVAEKRDEASKAIASG